MKITDVKVKRVKSDGNMKGIAHVTFDDVFVVHDIKVIVPTSGDKKPFIAMPSKRNPKKGNWTDIVHPIKDKENPAARDLRAELEDAIFEKFNALPEDDAEAIDADDVEVVE